MTQTFAILAGLPGSGKSTLATRLRQERGFFVISTDGLRLAMNADVYPREPNGEYAAIEPVVWEVARVAVERFLKAGRNVAIDATHLARASRAEWRDFARACVPGVRVEVHWCTRRGDSAQRWATQRGHTEQEYAAIRQRLEAAVETPSHDEADALVIHGGTAN